MAWLSRLWSLLSRPWWWLLAKRKKHKPDPRIVKVCYSCHDEKECPWLVMVGRREWPCCSDCTVEAKKDSYNFRMTPLDGEK